ncbi:MAG: hypothetical protein KAU20_05790 [Nanoarchaeota archaeon]|nr:hypothetical protein [Nanoarchaeota archaeon]
MKFEEFLSKPIDLMSDEEIAELVSKLSVPEIARLEKAIFNKMGRKQRPSKKVKEDVDLFDKIVGVDVSK